MTTSRSKEQLVEAMAESAHDAWWKTYIALGYTTRRAAWGEEFMVPFDQLSERGKDFDRLIMRAILTCFDREGFKVVNAEEHQEFAAHANPPERRAARSCGH